MKIILSGGGTLGPVVPLLAIAEKYRRVHPETEFVWVGTKTGAEKELVESYKIPFFTINAGKWRRYFSLMNIVDMIKVFFAFWQSLFLIWHEKPDLLITAGGFVSVPLHLAGATLGVPAWVHQQDLRLGLANRLMAITAQKITVALRDSLADFSLKKTEWLGNPVRDLDHPDLMVARQKFNLLPDAPIILALGGGTGSARINKMVLEAMPNWPQNWQIIHLTGKTRPHELSDRAGALFPNYHPYQFLTTDMKDAYALAEVVIARAGFATITEAASLSKALVLVPISGTHQEDNANLLDKNNAAVVLDERTDDGLKLAQVVKELMELPEKRQNLGVRLKTVLPPAKPERIVAIIEELTKKQA